MTPSEIVARAIHNYMVSSVDPDHVQIAEIERLVALRDSCGGDLYMLRRELGQPDDRHTPFLLFKPGPQATSDWKGF